MRKIPPVERWPVLEKMQRKIEYLFGENPEALIFLDDLCVMVNIQPYQRALPNMKDEDAARLIQLAKDYDNIDFARDHEDGDVIQLKVCGEIDRLLKEIIARETPV